MRKTGIVLAGLAAAGLGVGIGVLTETTDAEGSAVDFSSAGYFKSEDRDRVRAFHSSQPVSETEALQLFERQTITTGRVTRFVIYVGADNPAPEDDLTLAGSLQNALAITVSPPHDDWSWMYMVNPAGEATLKRP